MLKITPTQITSGRIKPNVLLALTWVMMTFVAACNSQSVPEASDDYSQLRDQFLAQQPLEGKVLSPADIKDIAAGDDASLPPGMDPIPPIDTTKATTLITGRIDAGEFAAFSKGEASFVLSQLPDEGHGEGDPDHADNCPFCKRKLANAPKAIVRLSDEEQSLIPVSADELLGISEDDVVVVQGPARYDETLNSVLVDATKVYLQP